MQAYECVLHVVRSHQPANRSVGERAMLKRIVVALSLLFAFGMATRTTTAAEEEPDNTASHAALASKVAAKEVKKFTFRFADDPDAKLELHPTPILRYTNPLRVEVYSTLFVWMHKGRPEVIASVSSWHSPRQYLGLAATSLSEHKLVGEREGREIWRPQKAGIEFRPIFEAGAPGATSIVRLRQMGLLAQQFTAEFRRDATVPEGGKLRLLSRPLHRYNSTRDTVLDGAMFGFADGTAPHLILLIEARQTPTDARWEYALAPKNSTEFHVRHADRPVWSLPQLAPPWPNSKNPTHTYTVFPDLTNEGRSQELADQLVKALGMPPASRTDR